MRAHLPCLRQFEWKEAKEEELCPVEKNCEAPVQSGHPGPYQRPSTITQHTRFNYSPVTRIKEASLQIQSQTNSPSSFSYSVVSQRGVPESSARLRLAVPLMWACVEGCSCISLTGCCRSRGEEGEWSGGGWEGVHSVHHRQRNTKDRCWRPILPRGQH